MVGRYCAMEPLDPVLHAAELWDAFRLDAQGRDWTYLPYGPFEDEGEFRSWVESAAVGEDPLFYTILDPSDHAVGVASYLRIFPEIGSMEVGHIHYAPALQRSRAATEAMYLMMRRAFDELGYRRYEWKCDSLNAPSRRAAERLGFVYEGTFRQATIYKGRNRDTAWFAMLDTEWPPARKAFEAWLKEDNFDAKGQQKAKLRVRP